MKIETIDRYVQSLIQHSSPERTAWNIEKMRQGEKPAWNYIDGCMCTALLALSDITRDRCYEDFTERLIDAFVNEDGSIRTFRSDAHSLDDINEGRVLFPLYRITGKEKYRRAAMFLRRQLNRQPRTEEGNFWHKQIYPDQVWLDGIYMAQPFAALYEKNFGTGDYSDILRQILNVRNHMRDPGTGLYYHGYDASRRAFWCDPESGCSHSFWLRAIGWFSVALADLSEILPPGGAREEIAGIFRTLMKDVSRYADPENGLYAQVIDQPGREGNYQESSGSSMIACAMLKGARIGVLPASFASMGRKTFLGIVKHCLKTAGGVPELGSICLVAGLGPENNRRRDGTYGYYISEPVVSNDAKGVAPFLLCYTEMLRTPNEDQEGSSWHI